MRFSNLRLVGDPDALLVWSTLYPSVFLQAPVVHVTMPKSLHHPRGISDDHFPDDLRCVLDVLRESKGLQSFSISCYIVWSGPLAPMLAKLSRLAQMLPVHPLHNAVSRSEAQCVHTYFDRKATRSSPSIVGAKLNYHALCSTPHGQYPTVYPVLLEHDSAGSRAAVIG